METVRVLDPKTGVITEIPSSELAPGMVRARVQGLEGDVFISADYVKPGEQREYEFDELHKRMTRVLWSNISDIWEGEYEEWVDGFKRDANPEREVGIWVSIVAGYNYFVKDRGYGSKQRRAILDFLCLFSINGPAVLDTVSTDSPENRATLEAMVSALLEGRAQGQVDDLLRAAGWA